MVTKTVKDGEKEEKVQPEQKVKREYRRSKTKKYRKTRQEEENFVPLSKQDENYEPPEPTEKPKTVTPNSRFLPYEDAKEFVRSENITSATMYEKFIKREKPGVLPAFPQRVYKDFGWVSWMEFLGTNNTFGTAPKAYKPYLEAVKWANALGLSTKAQWMDVAQSGQLPDDIPKRPDLTYEKVWRSWRHWLGSTPANIIDINRVVKQNPILYILREIGATIPTNIYYIDKHYDTFYSLREMWEGVNCQVIKFYDLEEGLEEQVDKIINTLSTPYYEDNKRRIVPNIYAILWELDIILKPLKKQQEIKQSSELIF